MIGLAGLREPTRRGFTLVEVIIVSVLSLWVIHSLFNILYVTQNRYSKEQGEILCAQDAALFLDILNRDLERCHAGFPPEIPVMKSIHEAFIVSESHFQLSIKNKGGPTLVDYFLDDQKKKMVRVEAGEAHEYCAGKVASFTMIMKLLLQDGSVFSIPGDPEVDAEPVFPKNPCVARLWFKMRMFLEIPKRGGHPRVAQEYRVLLFPVETNKRLNSIWRWTSPAK